MAVVICNAGEIKLLNWALRSTTVPANLTLQLYTNNYTPIATSVTGDFTVATFTGYSDKTLTRSYWSSPTTISDSAETNYPTLSWSVSSSATIYGYLVIDSTSALIWAEKFASPEVLTTGSTFELDVSFSLYSA